MAFINSKWAASPINLSDPLTHESWVGAFDHQLAIPGGYMWTKNDANFLYVAIDIIEDTNNDPGTGDYFWFTFDTNRNRTITPNKDLNYGAYVNQPNKMGKQYYLGPGRWTGLSHDESKAASKIDFDISPNSSTAHRIWKLKFKLTEINVSLLPWWWSSYTFFGLRLHSSVPNLNYDTPSNFYTNFSKLHTIYFSRKPSITVTDLGPVMGSVGLIPTTKISSTTGKATTASNYYIHTQNAAFGGKLNIIGNRIQVQSLYNASARKYKVLHREGKSGTFKPFASAWTNYVWNGSDYVLRSYAMNNDDFYYIPYPGSDYSIDDLLLQFDSTKLKTGFHQFKIEFYTYSNIQVSSPSQTLTLYIDNNVPEVSINSIKHNGATINACGIVNLDSATDGITFDYNAFDQEGNLSGYNLRAFWGDNKSALINSEKYTTSLGTSWQGAKNITTPVTGVWIPPVQCAYTFAVTASARTTNGYGFVGRNVSKKSVTILK